MTEGCGTGYGVRKFDWHPARAHVGAALTEEDSLGPHPVGGEDASRPLPQRLAFFLLTAPPPFTSG